MLLKILGKILTFIGIILGFAIFLSPIFISFYMDNYWYFFLFSITWLPGAFVGIGLKILGDNIAEK